MGRCSSGNFAQTSNLGSPEGEGEDEAPPVLESRARHEKSRGNATGRARSSWSAMTSESWSGQASPWHARPQSPLRLMTPRAHCRRRRRYILVSVHVERSGDGDVSPSRAL